METQYFTIVSLEASNSVSFSSSYSTNNVIMYLAEGSSTWQTLEAGSSITINANKEVKFKCTNPATSTAYPYGMGTFTISKKCNVKGNIMSLLYGDDFEGQIDLTGKNNTFDSLFYNCSKIIDASNLILPATTLANNCYSRMFYGCTSLTQVPELAATTLAKECYQNMFHGCTSLAQAPALPATTLANHCYQSMFYGCTSLAQAPELPATTLASYCYQSMFRGCSKLTAAPELPATTIANYCYYYMFEGCSKLATVSELPATTLTNWCYTNMFENCTSLTTPPKLPATTLASCCYYCMFKGCTSLTMTPVLSANTLVGACYSEMFKGCTNLTISPELPAMTLVSQCYQRMFEGCSNLNYIKMLATDISATSCLGNWVNGVSSTGTFVKHLDMNSLTTGNSGTPSGWTVQNDRSNIYYKEYFTIKSLESNNELSFSNSIQYQLEGLSTWSTLNSGEKLILNTNQEIKFKINNPTILSNTGIGTFTISKECNVKGNIMSLLYGDDFKGQTDLTGKNYAFYKLFNNCTNIVDAYNLILPATTLASYCYSNMFYDCTGLITAPALPATTLVSYCYSNMFKNCTSLTTPPNLPATTLASYCYYNMFYGCTGLTTAPALPATTLASCCYRDMFINCTGLTTAPELPAANLVNACYANMFYGCNKLNYIKMLATAMEDSTCLSYWVKDVASTGTFVKNVNMTSLSTGYNGIPSGWTVQNDFYKIATKTYMNSSVRKGLWWTDNNRCVTSSMCTGIDLVSVNTSLTPNPSVTDSAGTPWTRLIKRKALSRNQDDVTIYFGIWNDKASNAKLDYIDVEISTSSDAGSGTWTDISSNISQSPGSVNSTYTNTVPFTIPSTYNLATTQYYIRVRCGDTDNNQSWSYAWGNSANITSLTYGSASTRQNLSTNAIPLQRMSSTGDSILMDGEHFGGNYGRSALKAACFKIK